MRRSCLPWFYTRPEKRDGRACSRLCALIGVRRDAHSQVGTGGGQVRLTPDSDSPAIRDCGHGALRRRYRNSSSPTKPGSKNGELAHNDMLRSLGRARLSAGEVIKSRVNKNVPYPGARLITWPPAPAILRLRFVVDLDAVIIKRKRISCLQSSKVTSAIPNENRPELGFPKLLFDCLISAVTNGTDSATCVHEYPPMLTRLFQTKALLRPNERQSAASPASRACSGPS
jgi:hypothetical protein